MGILLLSHSSGAVKKITLDCGVWRPLGLKVEIYFSYVCTLKS